MLDQAEVVKLNLTRAWLAAEALGGDTFATSAERLPQQSAMEYFDGLQALDDLKPSLFDLISEQQLSSLLPPSLRYVIAVTAHRHPRYLLRILNSFDELYALLMFFIERHYLKTYGGGFTENFYGLKRERVLAIKGGEALRAQIGAPEVIRETVKLSRKDMWRNLAVMVGLPYVKRKLDEGYDIHAPQATVLGPAYHRDEMPPNATLKQQFMFYYKWFLRHVYPSVNAGYYFAILAFNLAYLTDGSKYSSPFLWLISTRMRRLSSADYHAIALAAEPAPQASLEGQPPQSSLSILHPRVFFSTVYPRMLSSLRFLLPTSVFVLKFLEWWYASDFARQLSKKASEDLDLSPPRISLPDPRRQPIKSTATGLKSNLKVNKQPAESEYSRTLSISPPIALPSLLPILTVQLPPAEESDLCPICRSAIVTPTACPTGYVYCFKCIHNWIDGNHDFQEAFMKGETLDENHFNLALTDGTPDSPKRKDSPTQQTQGRVGAWESGAGRCAVTGRRILGGVDGLRRVIV